MTEEVFSATAVDSGGRKWQTVVVVGGGGISQRLHQLRWTRTADEDGRGGGSIDIGCGCVSS